MLVSACKTGMMYFLFCYHTARTSEGVTLSSTAEYAHGFFLSHSQAVGGDQVMKARLVSRISAESSLPSLVYSRYSHIVVTRGHILALYLV